MVNILNLAEVQEQKQIDEITNCIVDSLINEVEKSLLGKAIGKLSDREQTIVKLRFGINMPEGKE